MKINGKITRFVFRRQKAWLTVFVFILTLFFTSSISFAQNAAPLPSPTPAASPPPSPEKRFLSNILKDQGVIWTSPFHRRNYNLRWTAALGIASAALFATDKQTARALDYNPNRLRISRDISRFGNGYTVGGTAAAVYLFGRITHNRRAAETGLLAAEAFIDAGIVTEALKITTQRPRPLDKERNGEFFDGGNSFVSGHSSSIWSLAAVISDEYGKKRPLVRFAVYGLAAAVSLSRYTGQNHYLSDILLGSALGYGIGHFVYLRHHDANLDLPVKTKKITKIEKFFPRISPQYNAGNHISGVGLMWNF